MIAPAPPFHQSPPACYPAAVIITQRQGYGGSRWQQRQLHQLSEYGWAEEDACTSTRMNTSCSHSLLPQYQRGGRCGPLGPLQGERFCDFRPHRECRTGCLRSSAGEEYCIAMEIGFLSLHDERKLTCGFIFSLMLLMRLSIPTNAVRYAERGGFILPVIVHGL